MNARRISPDRDHAHAGSEKNSCRNRIDTSQHNSADINSSPTNQTNSDNCTGKTDRPIPRTDSGNLHSRNTQTGTDKTDSFPTTRRRYRTNGTIFVSCSPRTPQRTTSHRGSTQNRKLQARRHAPQTVSEQSMARRKAPRTKIPNHPPRNARNAFLRKMEHRGHSRQFPSS